jgi:hypothetical protein
MFVLTQEQATTIRTAYEDRGELSAAVELRRLFPGIATIKAARECVRSIAVWALPVKHGAVPVPSSSLRARNLSQSRSSARLPLVSVAGGKP